MKRVTILADTREQKNQHILQALDRFGVMYEQRKLDFGDYSFLIDGRDFSRSCIVERKASVDELYGNITADRERIEKELDTIARNARQCILLIETCPGWEALQHTALTAEEMAAAGRQNQFIGKTCYSTLQSWRCGNRYGFSVEFVPDASQTAVKLLERFYWYYHNYKKQTAARRQ